MASSHDRDTTTSERAPLMKTPIGNTESPEVHRGDSLELRYRQHGGNGDESSPAGGAGTEPKVRFRQFAARDKNGISGIEDPVSLDYGDDDSDTESSDDEIQYCDCIAVALQHSLPGTPGKKGVIPYVSVYDTKDQARRRGYWIPGVPVNARITKVERNTDRRFHLINSLLYTIELEHGEFRWQVVRNYNDFTTLHNRLMFHRTREQIMAPIKRTRERVDSYLESWGVDVIPDHKEDCPYYVHPGQVPRRKSRHQHKYEVLKREADAFEANGNQAPLATVETPSSEMPGEDFYKREYSVQQAVQSGILEPDGPAGSRTNDTTTTIDSETGEPSPRRSRRRRTRQKHRLPPFPKTPDSLVTNLEQRREQLENWLQMFLHIPINRNHHETAEFLEVSRYSFVNDLGGKHTEGFVKKRPGGNRVFIGWRQCCFRYFLPWNKRWLMVRDSFVSYMDPHSEQIRLVMLMDRDFKVCAGGKEADGMPTGLIIFNSQYELHLKCKRIQDTLRWKEIIEGSMKGIGSCWIEPHRYSSTFPIRENSYAKWFVDAKPYWEFAADMMELAREEIFIADWWLSPEVYMKRPALQGNYWRLDEILKRKAQQGVRIFVLIYKEVEQALGLNSMYTKRTLQALHPNIKVMRHPDHLKAGGTFFWAHHEKLLIVDQLISFVGGIDLCFGRWDNTNHQLTDLGSIQFAETHAVATDLQSGLRALAKAPLTLSPLGLEENEMVSPREEDPIRLDANRPSIRQFTHIQIGEDVDQIDYVNTNTGRGARHALNSEEGTNEIVYTDKDTGEVVMKVVKRTPTPNSVPPERPDQIPPAAVANAAYRHSSPSPIGRLGTSPASTPTGTLEQGQQASGTDTTTSGRKATLRIINDTRGKKQVRRFISAIDKKSPVPLEVLDNAGPPTSIFDKAAKQGLDMADIASKYKEYVESGAVEKEKHRAATPPLSKRKMVGTKRLSRAVGNWKANRAKRKWKQMLNTDEMTMAYELDWLRLKEMEEENGTDELDGVAKLWIGKDYVNYIVRDFVEVQLPFHDFIDRGATPRMPWHDIHSVTFGASARDVARHFIQRWNATKTEKMKDDQAYPYLLPKSYENVKVPRVFKSPTTSDQVNVQVLRSLCEWSGAINHTEDSIQMAYLSLIANSKHYIYIENQFFISLIDSKDVSNEVCKVICERIVRAYKDKETYRVYILIPLLPGFEGDVGAPGGSALQAVLHWTYQSLSQGEHSLLNRLKGQVDDPFKYISVCSLRTYDYLGRKLVSELIYIHCKLLIVDDEHVIIGSANINDRSQAGNCDSEVCLLFSDVIKEKSMMNGKPYQAGKFAKSLRMQCMKEHLGLLADARRPAQFKYPVTCDDPVEDAFFVDVWQATAKSNTTIYEEVFRAYPTDHVETFEEYKKWKSQMPLAEYSPQQAEEKLRDVRGVLVEFPMNFLSKATLTPRVLSKEGLVPTNVFT